MLSDARAQMFITAFYGILDLETGRMIYCNAGHNPPLLIRENGRGCCQQLKPNGMALGIDENAAWVAISQRIALGDTLLLYTDGIVEAMNTRGDFYGIDRLTDTVRQIANRPSQWIIKAVRDSVEDFQGNIHQTDDITMVCLRRRE
jgi:sigma-B regulation protein RsbU (phosphoserine phosphatase)